MVRASDSQLIKLRTSVKYDTLGNSPAINFFIRFRRLLDTSTFKSSKLLTYFHLFLCVCDASPATNTRERPCWLISELRNAKKTGMWPVLLAVGDKKSISLWALAACRRHSSSFLTVQEILWIELDADHFLQKFLRSQFQVPVRPVQFLLLPEGGDITRLRNNNNNRSWQFMLI